MHLIYKTVSSIQGKAARGDRERERSPKTLVQEHSVFISQPLSSNTIFFFFLQFFQHPNSPVLLSAAAIQGELHSDWTGIPEEEKPHNCTDSHHEDIDVREQEVSGVTPRFLAW